MRDGKREIPFVKPVRLHNFKIWRGKTTIGSGKDKAGIEQINIATDDGWQVKIPEGMELFILLKDLFANNMLDAIHTYASNIYNTSIIGNGYFHGGLAMVAKAYCNPDLLVDGGKEHEEFVGKAETLSKSFLDWVAVAREHAKENEPTDEDVERDGMADDMMDVLSKEDGDGTEE